MYKIFSEKLRETIQNNNKVIVGYLLAGYKDKQNFVENIKTLEDSSIGIFEIGYPSKNPYADGKTISDAHRMVNFHEATSIEYWKEIRKLTTKAIWLMAYNADFIKTKKYLQFAKERIVDAFVIPDMENQERINIQKEVSEYGVDIIGFANPLMKENELIEVFDNFSLVYEQLYVGQTGIAQTKEIYHKMLETTCNYGKSIAFAGFGLNSYEKIKKVLNEGYFGAIIGTELIRRINKSSESVKELLKEINKAVE